MSLTLAVVLLTRFRYLFSPKIPEHISFSTALLSLTSSIITHLGHGHHEPELSEAETDGYIVSGAYNLHIFASTNWLQLVTLYLDRVDSKNWSVDLLEGLDRLSVARPSPEYESEGATDSSGLSFTALEKDWPKVRRLLSDVHRLHNQSSQALYSLDHGMVQNQVALGSIRMAKMTYPKTQDGLTSIH